MGNDKDVLDTTVSFLQKRDGTDKLLKILRYSAQLVLALDVLASRPEASKRLKSFEASVGVSRKALRIGKFLQDIDDLRRAPSFATAEGFLELVSAGGECIYYFVEQFIWLVKAGAMDKKHGARLQKISAIFELVGYTGSVTLKAIQVADMFHKEKVILLSLQSQSCPSLTLGNVQEVDNNKDSSQGEDPRRLKDTAERSSQNQIAALKVLRFKRTLKVLSLIQDLSDSLLAVADVIDGPKQPKFLRNPAFLAAAGLLSAAISAHKNWVSS